MGTEEGDLGSGEPELGVGDGGGRHGEPIAGLYEVDFEVVAGMLRKDKRGWRGRLRKIYADGRSERCAGRIYLYPQRDAKPREDCNIGRGSQGRTETGYIRAGLLAVIVVIVPT